MIILNSLKSITVITATVVLSYFIWNKIVAWEKTAKCGAPDFSHFTETCLRRKLLSSPSSVRELERHSPLWQWPCRWEPLWNGVTFSTGRRKAQLQCLRASPSSTESTAEEAALPRRQPESPFRFAAETPLQQTAAFHSSSRIPFHTLLPGALCKQEKLSHRYRQPLIPNTENPTGEKLSCPQEVFRSLLSLKQSLNKENIIIQG